MLEVHSRNAAPRLSIADAARSRAAASGETRIGAVVDRLAQEIGLTVEERVELLPSGKQSIFANRAHWAKTYLNKAGLVESARRGYFTISTRGHQVLESYPRHIDNAFLNQFE
jgi:restriction system protein